MSKLSDWVEQNTTLTQKKFNENDITTNYKIKKLFFEQLDNLEFSFERINDTTKVFGGTEYRIQLRLDYPRKTETPYSFIFNPQKLTLIPQYTATHRVYRPATDDEADVLTNLGFYLAANEKNNDKSNPDKRRECSKNFFERRGFVQNDVIVFPLYESEKGADGTMVLKYRDSDGEKVIAYQANEPDFTVVQEFRQIRINRQDSMGEHMWGVTDDVDVMNGECFYVYNYPDYTDPHNYILTARY